MEKAFRVVVGVAALCAAFAIFLVFSAWRLAEGERREEEADEAIQNSPAPHTFASEVWACPSSPVDAGPIWKAIERYKTGRVRGVESFEQLGGDTSFRVELLTGRARYVFTFAPGTGSHRVPPRLGVWEYPKGGGPSRASYSDIRVDGCVNDGTGEVAPDLSWWGDLPDEGGGRHDAWQATYAAAMDVFVSRAGLPPPSARFGRP